MDIQGLDPGGMESTLAQVSKEPGMSRAPTEGILVNKQREWTADVPNVDGP